MKAPTTSPGDPVALKENCIRTDVIVSTGKLVMRYALLDSRYDVVRHACSLQPGWTCAAAKEDADLIWTDVCLSAEDFARLRSFQRYNHFIGMHAITRKNNLSRNLMRMQQRFGSEYDFVPMTWILPNEMVRFRTFAAENGGIYIIKPDNSSQGRGIFLTKQADSVPSSLLPEQGYVAQRYIPNPYLIEGHKFDMRIYVLVTGCDPLRIYIHEEGLIRLCCNSYDAKGVYLDDVTRHLTNYAINAKDPNFVENSNPDNVHDGHKRSLRLFLDLLSIGHDTKKLSDEVDGIIIKTLLSIQPSLAHASFSYQAGDANNDNCFEILGFDVLLDADMKPWLLEVNHAPSFATESQLDWIVKTKVIDDAFRLLAMTPKPRDARKTAGMKDMPTRTKLAQERDQKETNLGGYRKIYPTAAKEAEYSRFHDTALELWNRFTGHAGSRKPIRIFTSHESEIVPEKKISRTRSQERMKLVHPPSPRAVSSPVARVRAPTNARPKPSLRAFRRGKTIRVLTSRGWEKVTILKIHTEQRMDIRFRDGETMINVLPKIYMPT